MKRECLRQLFVYSLLNCFCLVSATPVLNYDIWGDGDANNISVSFMNNSEINTAPSRDPKVLNFFPIPVEEECLSNDGRRKGVCMNTYECRIQGGTSFGFCALGFGVCCVFTATCDQDIYNNITYFVNPHFPDLSLGMSTCNLKLRKIDSEVSQIRLDFVHFNLGQPNRRTGICDEDIFVMTGGSSKDLTLCGINSGQHVYFDVENVEDAIGISVNLSRRTVARLWEVRITQIPFAQRAPVGCLQYHTGTTGVIQTMNFAENGRHLANQDYNICMRQEKGMCSIGYEPCDDNSFRIGPNVAFLGNLQMGLAQMQSALNPPAMNGQGDGTGQEVGPMVPEAASADEVAPADEADQETAASTMDDATDEVGSGDGAAEARSMEVCVDKIVMPCDSDDLLMPGDPVQGFCNIAHCGNSFCPLGKRPCRIESSVTPFRIGVHFGPSARESFPDDNLGMCLNYQQLPCIG